MKTNSLCLFIIAVMCMNVAKAQTSEVKITASDGELLNVFGESVSISGDYAIVGAYQRNSAYIFKRDGANWTEQVKLAPSEIGTDVFGFSVAISGDYAVIGAPGDNDIPSNGGAVYFYERNTGTDTWEQVAKRTAEDGHGQDEFGIAVSIAGDYAIVGSHKDDDMGNNSGSAYIFFRSEGTWTEQDKLTASNGEEDDNFGITVSITDDYAIVGAPLNHEIAIQAGAAYVFKRDTTSWTEQAKLLASDAAENSAFGISVSIDGDYAIAGATLAEGNAVVSGAAYVFMKDGENWAEQAKIFAGDGGSSDYFGGSVSIDGDYAVVGAMVSDGLVPGAGSAYIFKRDGTLWTEINKLTASDGASDDNFGTSVSVSGDYAIIGASFDSDNGEMSGSAYIYNDLSNPVAIEGEISGTTETFTLEQNLPNPFSPLTKINYTLQQTAYVTLVVYNLQGQEMIRLVESEQRPGDYSVMVDGSSLTSGTYIYRMQADNFVRHRKMLLVK